MDAQGLTYLIAGIVSIFISLIVFLICREIFCWYFKTNEILALVNEMTSSLAAIKNYLRGNAANNQKSSPKGQIISEGNNQYRICGRCKEKNNVSLSSCWKCDAGL